MQFRRSVTHVAGRFCYLCPRPHNISMTSAHADTEFLGTPSESLLRFQLDLYIGIYKHHFDLFIKGLLLYLAVVGASAGFMFRGDVSTQTQLLLASGVAGLSTLAVVGCIVSRRWVRDMDSTVSGITAALGISPLPFSGARRIATLMGVAAGLGAISGIIGIVIAF